VGAERPGAVAFGDLVLGVRGGVAGHPLPRVAPEVGHRPVGGGGVARRPRTGAGAVLVDVGIDRVKPGHFSGEPGAAGLADDAEPDRLLTPPVGVLDEVEHPDRGVGPDVHRTVAGAEGFAGGLEGVDVCRDPGVAVRGVGGGEGSAAGLEGLVVG